MEYKLFNKKTKQWIDPNEDEEYKYFTDEEGNVYQLSNEEYSEPQLNKNIQKLENTGIRDVHNVEVYERALIKLVPQEGIENSSLEETREVQWSRKGGYWTFEMSTSELLFLLKDTPTVSYNNIMPILSHFKVEVVGSTMLENSTISSKIMEEYKQMEKEGKFAMYNRLLS